MLQVEEFSKAVYVQHLRAFKDSGLLIIWKHDFVDLDTDTDNNSQSHSDSDESCSVDSTSETEMDLSTVAFKCIGVTRDTSYQTALRSVKELLDRNENVTVRLVPEPDNAYDPHAICFKCELNTGWTTIGYVVSELCEDVHCAITSDSIDSVEFAWVKYKLWKKAPGYYAAINITRKGEWPQKVKKYCSTFF